MPDILGISKKVYDDAQELFDALAAVQLSTPRLEEYLTRLYPRTADQIKRRTYPRQWDDISELFESGGADVAALRGTVWNGYNAVVRCEDYRAARDRSPDHRLDRAWFGSGADLKHRALSVAQELARTWRN